ncbi:MAG TPA: DinB family protein [Marmoricola sp.]|nr:DinB family protein [Marmoricola sp.]
MPRRADMFATADQDPRATEPTGSGDEKSTLVEYIRYQRQTLELKCSGLDPEQLARRSVEPSTMSLLGLVRHLADVERGWFRRRLAGQDVPHLYSTEEDQDGEFDHAVGTEECVADAWARLAQEQAFTDSYIAGVEDLGHTVDYERGRVSVREVLVHIVEEYARHNGHADLLRERIDGRIGE